MGDIQPGDRTSPDMTASSPWLTIKEASLLFAELDLPRNERSIRRYCKKGKLDCKSIENDNRVFEHRVRTDSLRSFVQEHKTLSDTSGHARASPDMTDGDRPETPALHKDSGHADTSDTDRVSGRPRMTEVVEQDLRERVGELKDQLKIKDEQIATNHKTITTMLERDRETNILIKNLQELLGAKQLVAGEGDPNGSTHPSSAREDADLHEAALDQEPRSA